MIPRASHYPGQGLKYHMFCRVAQLIAEVAQAEIASRRVSSVVASSNPNSVALASTPIRARRLELAAVVREGEIAALTALAACMASIASRLISRLLLILYLKLDGSLLLIKSLSDIMLKGCRAVSMSYPCQLAFLFVVIKQFCSDIDIIAASVCACANLSVPVLLE